MNNIVNKLCEEVDSDTIQNNNHSKLYLVGGETQFLKAIANKGNKLGVECIFKDNNFVTPYVPAVVDTESYKEPFSLWERQDIDCLQNKDLSCCANAISRVLHEIGVSGKTVCIIGRGHAVQGLAEMLIYQDATVTVCHSKTQNLYEATLFADILVVAAPVKPAQVSSLVEKIVVDVSGTFKGFVPSERYVGNIGKLTTSILLNRACKRK
jgi:methylenetetrahydrofolate dehydrogenase (NADP+)/methenyltetrahydrofolate cyclohydrolase